MIEVFRISPEIGKTYETATYTHSTGSWPNQKYYAKEVTYVGKFIKHESQGYRDNAIHWDTFLLEDKHIQVYYTYEGTTCFREVI
jgi:hypothetical protein